jgi:hypothetical protein
MVHLRDIQLRGYEREDGLLEVEAHLSDVKPYSHPGHFGAGDPVHDMWLRVAIDRELVIQECEAAMEATPYRACPMAAPNMHRLVGLKIGKGFIKSAMALLGGGEGCAHLRELLQPIATTAMQSMAIFRLEAARPGEKLTTPALIGSCYAYREDGEIVADLRARAAANTAD